MAGCTLILHGGRLLTCDDSFSMAQGIAIAGTRILAVGSDADVLAHRVPSTRIIDLRGASAMPGLVDGHAHMDREGLRDVLPTLAGARSIGDIVERIVALTRVTPPGEWIVTMPVGDPPEYDNVPGCLREGRYPNRHDLDRAAPDHPVYIKPIWGWWRNRPPLVSIANSRALALAGIDRDTPSRSPDIEIEREPVTGAPTGVFLENTQMSIVELSLMAAAPGFTHAQRVAGLRRSMTVYNSFGTTSVFEGHGVAPEVIAAYQSIAERGAASVRATLVFSPSWMQARGDARELLRSWGDWLGRKGLGDVWLRVQGLYAAIETDALNNRLRARCHPRTGWAGFCYDASLPREMLTELLAEAARNRIRVAGIWHNLIELYEQANAVAPIAGQRWVLGHQLTLGADDIVRLRDLGVVITTDTNRHIYKDGAAVRRRLGPERENEIVPLRKLLDAGVPFAFGGNNLRPSLFHPTWHAISRRALEDGEPVAPAQALTRAEALCAATRGGAYLTFEELDKGALAPGMLADLVVLDGDPLKVSEDAIKDIRARMTIVGGRIVWRDDGVESPDMGSP